MNALRVGVFGCGRIAAMVHAPILSRMSGVKIVALVDSDVANRARVALHASAATHFSDWETPFELGVIDAAVICLPPKLHAPVALAAFEHGCAAYIEKPPALTVQEAEEIDSAATASEQIAMVGFNFRFHPQFEALRTAIAADDYGRVLSIRTLFSSAKRSLPDWKNQASQGGDALFDLAIHHIDLVSFLTGLAWNPITIDATVVRDNSGTAVMLTGILGDEVLVDITATQTTGASAHRLELLTEKGHVYIDLAEPGPPVLRHPVDGSMRRKWVLTTLAALAPRKLLYNPAYEPSFERSLGAFVRAARQATPVTPNTSAGVRALRVAVHAAEIAAKKARPLDRIEKNAH